ncbi:MAG: thiamine diphosphokinase [Euryarchaeota archaeon]|jgi:thiamine pyrophosphokinase|nr:thiamine diphosphokinase [Euryarchaeota archaeon]MBT3971540.1 thiamine diphosphokinase [Euryarchaeota archaeon]MBT4407137.1 thiamine diphosphokinase [Euryarchaeota archaeon]MBT6645079.1 thiamine diphosphokinase [Euryarchaeota archaeon]
MGEGFWLIAANGEWGATPYLNDQLKNASWIIAADGGARELAKRGFHANVIIGDFDSLSIDDKKFHQNAQIIEVKSQEETDLVKALNYCHLNGAKEVVIIGVDGGRTDHVLGVFATLFEAPPDLPVSLIHKDGVSYLIPPISSKPFQCGEHVSVFAIGGEVMGLCIRGFEYEVEDRVLSFSTRGIHNVCTSESAQITFDNEKSQGRLLIYRKN